jgi:hypothetical protein
MSHYYSERDINDMISAGIISDPNRAPDLSTILFIEKQHKCPDCSSENISYERIKGGAIREYHFICEDCGCTNRDFPLKRSK